MVQAIGIPVEAYLACDDDYYRKVKVPITTVGVVFFASCIGSAAPPLLNRNSPQYC